MMSFWIPWQSKIQVKCFAFKICLYPFKNIILLISVVSFLKKTGQIPKKQDSPVKYPADGHSDCVQVI